MLAGGQAKQLFGPVLVLLILGMMILPLPPFILDIFFTFNIAISILVLLVSLYTVKALEFSIFPAILLVTTLLRLSLNVASTRQVMLHGHEGPDAAGAVIEAFGHFLVGGNFTVGILVFVILVVINFVVITKGAGRIAEVGARFTLDAMPGKQMAIDADLNAGLIGEEEARTRRAEVGQEADFYGAMDGASKFVRGDAVAGILIMLINIIGGLMIGVIQHDLPIADALRTYTLLTIGDGLVAQIPGLVISTAAGIMVSRVTSDQGLSDQIIVQMLNRPEALGITGFILALMGMIPNMPHLSFFTMALALMGVAYYAKNQKLIIAGDGAEPQAAPRGGPAPAPGAAGDQGAAPSSAVPGAPSPAAAQSMPEVSWKDVEMLDVLGLEIGYRLIPFVDQSTGAELLKRIKNIRKNLAQKFGFLIPSMHIRDNTAELRPSEYRLMLKGVPIGRGEVYPGQFMAINPGKVLGPIDGTSARDPAYGLPAVWIESAKRDQAIALGYTVVEPTGVMVTHLSTLLERYAHELLGREETQEWIDNIGRQSPKLIEDLVPKTLSLSALQRVLQSLLTEGLPLRDARTILETLAEWAPKTPDPDELTAHIRIRMGRALIQSLFGNAERLDLIALEPGLERLLLQSLQSKPAGASTPAWEPGLLETLIQQAQNMVQERNVRGDDHPLVLLVPSPLRGPISRFLKRAIPEWNVISHTEIPDNKSIQIVGLLGRA
ncbi:MAG: flagellar biosynthesis protein FlhA [Pseudomonadota bacterium]